MSSTPITYGEEEALEQTTEFDREHQHAASARLASPARAAVPPEVYFDSDRCARWIRRVRARRVALQFADEWLGDARLCTTLLREALADAAADVELFVLGDTSYGSCCVDEVAAAHTTADAVIHFGRSCLSVTCRLPVLLVFGRAPLDVDRLVAALAALPGRPVLFYDTEFEHALASESAQRRIADAAPRVRVARVAVHRWQPAANGSASAVQVDGDDETAEQSGADASTAASEAQRCVAGRVFEWPESELESVPADASDEAPLSCSWRSRLPIDAFTPIWLGSASSPTAKVIQVALQRHAMQVLDPETFVTKPLPFSATRFLMRRHAMVERCRTAETIALLSGTLAAARHSDLLIYLRQLVRTSETRVYTIVVGKMNEAKLANIAAVDAYALIACRESTLEACETRSFGAPIVTPLELQMAFDSGSTWDSDYTTDFDHVLERKTLLEARRASRVGGTANDVEDTVVHMSLNTGRIVERKRAPVPTDAPPSSSTALAASAGGGALVESFHSSAVVRHLQKSTFKGLDPRVGQDEPSPLEEGRSGIAAGYANEPGDDK